MLVGVALAALVVSIISVFIAVHAERRVTKTDEPELTIQFTHMNVEDLRGAAELPVVVRLVKGRGVARDVHLLVRIQHRLWHSRCADLGPGQAEASLSARYTNEPDLPDLQLPRRPFMEDGGTDPYLGDSAAVVAWLHGGRRHWAGNVLEWQRRNEWRLAGPTVRGSRPLLPWERQPSIG